MTPLKPNADSNKRVGPLRLGRSAYEAAVRGSETSCSTIDQNAMRAIIASYQASPEWRSLAAETKRSYNVHLNRIEEHWGARPITGLTSKHLRAIIRDRQNTPHAANRLLKVFNLLFKHAMSCGIVDDNPASRVAKLKAPSKGFTPWSEDEIARFEAHHPSGSKARLAFALALYTGQRRSDLVRMGWQNVKDGWVCVQQAKTSALLDIPIALPLAEELAYVSRGQLLFLQTEYGRPFTEAGAGNWFSKQVRAAGIRDRSLHGLRHACASRLADAGCTPSQIQAITGHRTLSEVSRYTQRADQRRNAAIAMERLENAQLSNHSSKVRQSDP